MLTFSLFPFSFLFLFPFPCHTKHGVRVISLRDEQLPIRAQEMSVLDLVWKQSKLGPTNCELWGWLTWNMKELSFLESPIHKHKKNGLFFFGDWKKKWRFQSSYSHRTFRLWVTFCFHKRSISTNLCMESFF